MSLAPGFEISYRRHLVAAQRRAILRTLSNELDPEEVTVGDVVDAARALGVAGELGRVSLEDLARELVGRPGETASNDGATVPATVPATSKVSAHAAARAQPRGTPVNGVAGPLDAERMDLDRAVSVFVPLVRELGEASMQALEERTGIGRRKLRFHVGQLVKAGHLARHGMGRGTHYTAI